MVEARLDFQRRYARPIPVKRGVPHRQTRTCRHRRNLRLDCHRVDEPFAPNQRGVTFLLHAQPIAHLSDNRPRDYGNIPCRIPSDKTCPGF